MERLPNFLIIGAQKAGTTSLYSYLNQHPQIYMSPVKEPNYFAYDERLDSGGQIRPRAAKIVSTLEDYEALFDGIHDETAWGEASPSYLYSARAPFRIHELIPDARMIAILRDPVERAFSNFVHTVRGGREPLRDFNEAIAAEDERIRQGWGPLFHYKHKGLYFQQLSRYLRIFDRSQFCIFLFDDLRRDPQGLAITALRFLEVDDQFRLDVSEKHNVSGLPKNNLSGRAYAALRRNDLFVALGKKVIPYGVRRLARSSVSEAPELPLETRKSLIEEFRDDILRLQELIGRDLTAWLE